MERPFHFTGRDAKASDELVLPDGARLRLRPIDAGDRDGLAVRFRRLGPESRRRRFLTPKHESMLRELTYLTVVEHIHREMFAAVDQVHRLVGR
jgi:hypothetical protein